MIKANVRDPDIFFGDMRAQEAALLKGEQRVVTSSGATVPTRSVARWKG